VSEDIFCSTCKCWHQANICCSCLKPKHAKPWIKQGVNSWALVDNHIIFAMFDSEQEALEVAHRLGLDMERLNT